MSYTNKELKAFFEWINTKATTRDIEADYGISKSKLSRMKKKYEAGKLQPIETTETKIETTEKIKSLEEETPTTPEQIEIPKEKKQNNDKHLEKLLKLLPEPSQILDFMEGNTAFPKTAYYLLDGKCRYLLTYTMEAIRLMIKGTGE